MFFLTFHLILVPKANEHVEPQPYRDYGRHRHRLLIRIINRAIHWANAKGIAPRKALRDFVISCFDPIDMGRDVSVDFAPESLDAYMHQLCSAPPMLAHMSRDSISLASADDSISVSSLDEDTSDILELGPTHWTIKGIGRSDMETLFSWALLGRDLHRCEQWELDELRKCFDEMEKQFGLVFEAGSGGLYKARLLSLENVSAFHRPLLVYLAVFAMKQIAGFILRLVGYRRLTTKSGLVGWYRPARDESGAKLLPFLFFHGIAPAGLFFYLPMVLFGFLYDGRASFLFENPNISCTVSFAALTEIEFVDGVKEILDNFYPPDHPLALCGHSFGSIPLTWMLHSRHFRNRIKQFVLLDPVSVLLSEPDIMVNFLYRKDVSTIRMVASSELFTEYYLRRHFYFFNSELWVDDIPKALCPIIALSEDDQIVNAPRVKDYLEVFSGATPPQIHYWHGVPHAFCVTEPAKWREVKQAMLRQELAFVQRL